MTATASEKKPSARSPEPPEERFWKRYSPHGEMPLSFAGSLSLHLLIIGGLVIATLYLGSFLFKEKRSLPVEPVRFGGGGGKVGGKGTGPGIGSGVEETGAENNTT